MTKDELLKIFKIKDLYEKYKKDDYLFEIMYFNILDPLNYINYYFREKEISIAITSSDFSENSEEKNFFITFNTTDNDSIVLIKDNFFQNEIFPFLTFKDLRNDLNFISGVINNVFIPKHSLFYRVSRLKQ